MKYVLVTGGVISGIGKGIISSSIGVNLKAYGLKVTSIKIDPYINIDAGTFSPYEHGEVFVLDDGGEVDLDLGNYERFLDVILSKDHNITTGKIYQSVIHKERRGDFLGKTVQVVPHITDAIQDWVEQVAHKPLASDPDEIPEVCIIELGGTVGDIESMSFIEAFRQFEFRLGKENFCNVHVSLIPQPQTTGEMKTKPTQTSVRELRGLGLSPDLLMCRCSGPMNKSVIDKLSMFCQVSPKHVISVQDVTSLYRVPLLLDQQKVANIIIQQFKLNPHVSRPKKYLLKWKELADRSDNCTSEVKIALVGKYVQLDDAYASVYKALNHAALFCNYKLVVNIVNSENLEDQSDPVAYHRAWEKLCTADGVLVPGGFGYRGVEGKIAAIKWCRENKKPLLGVCLGLQCMIIEFSRNILGWKSAHSTEFNPETEYPVVIDMPEFNPGDMGGTMRLGLRKTVMHNLASVENPVTPAGDCLKPHQLSKIQILYGNAKFINERHRHRYEVNPKYIDQLEKQGLQFVGKDVDNTRMEIVELFNHPYYVAVQFHPEYLSRPMKPSPPYLGLILAASNRLQTYLKNGCRFSPRNNSFLEESDEESEHSVMSIVREAERNLRLNNSTSTDDHDDSAVSS